MSEVRKHVHKLKRHRYSTGVKVYFCVDDCSFKITTELALGKSNICWRCGKSFKLNQYSIALAKPHCEDCHVYKGEPKTKTERRLAGRRKSDEFQKEETPAEQMINIQASAEVSNLRERLNSLTSATRAVAVLENPTTTKPTIVEYKPDEDDEDMI